MKGARTKKGSKEARLELRIIGGVLRGRRFHPPATPELRPTSDRARETLFNMLAANYLKPDGTPILQGARVLDAFAGSGALGLEAASRGAAQVDFIEQHPGTQAALAQTLRLVAPQVPQTQLNVHQGSALHPPRAAHAAHVVFLDPPYAFSDFDTLLTALRDVGWLAPHSLLVIERDAADSPPQLAHYDLDRQRSIGRNAFYFCLSNTGL